MKIRATAKVLNISKIKPITDERPTNQSMPGEWYAGVLSLLQPGKLAIHFLHHPTYVSIFIPGKSLNKVIPSLPVKIEMLLKRNNYESLISQYQIDTTHEIYKTNSRSMLGHMNQIKYEIGYLLSYRYPLGEIDFDHLEDNYLNYLFGGKFKDGTFTYPIQILNRLKETNQPHA